MLYCAGRNKADGVHLQILPLTPSRWLP